MEHAYLIAFIKDNKLTLVFSDTDSATYRLAERHKDGNVSAYGLFTVDRGNIFLTSMEGRKQFKLK